MSHRGWTRMMIKMMLIMTMKMFMMIMMMIMIIITITIIIAGVEVVGRLAAQGVDEETLKALVFLHGAAQVEFR